MPACDFLLDEKRSGTNVTSLSASLLIEQGENIKYIQSQLGHSTPTVTLNVYAHLMKPVNQEAACRLENLLFETNGDQMETKTKKEATK
jgi:integrase